MTRENDLNELVSMLSSAIEKARKLNLPTSVYILSMALLEVSQAAKATTDEDTEDESR